MVFCLQELKLNVLVNLALPLSSNKELHTRLFEISKKFHVSPKILFNTYVTVGLTGNLVIETMLICDRIVTKKTSHLSFIVPSKKSDKRLNRLKKHRVTTKLGII